MNMMLKFQVERIHELATKDRLAFKKHTFLRMYQRNISVDEVKRALQDCKMVEYYPDDYPLPSCLILGYIESKKAIHAVIGIDEQEAMLWVITVYEPNLLEWEEGFEKRRKKDEMSTL